MDNDTRAAKSFYRAVRSFALKAKSWESDAIYYDTQPDEVWDVTLVSSRVYGRRDEYLAVMAAAGLDTVDQPLTQRRLVLPSAGKLYALKRKAGFESIADYREDGAPTWLEG